MAIQVQRRRGTKAENAAFTGALGEIVALTDTDQLALHDASAAGGFVLPNELDIVNDYFGYNTSSGTDTITLTVLSTIAAYQAGQTFTAKLAGTNTGAATLNVNSLGAKTIKKMSGGALADVEAGDLVNGGIYTFKYDGTYFQVMNVAGGGGGVELETPVASTSGTSIDYTGLPSGVKQIFINCDGVSFSVNSPLLFQIGDSGGIETTGYLTNGAEVDSSPLSSAETSGFRPGTVGAFSHTKSGTLVLSLLDASNNIWSAIGLFAYSVNSTHVVAGTKALSAELDRIRITSVSGTDTFDAGSVNIQYQ